jgi:hypothetical protein
MGVLKSDCHGSPASPPFSGQVLQRTDIKAIWVNKKAVLKNNQQSQARSGGHMTPNPT